MISEISILDVIDAAEPTNVAGLISDALVGHTLVTPGIHSEADQTITLGDGKIQMRSVYADMTTNIDVDEGDIRELKTRTINVDEDLDVHGSANLASAYITGDVHINGYVNMTCMTSMNSANVNYLTINTQMDVCGSMRVQSQLMIEAYGDLRYNRNYQDRSMIDDMIQVRNDVDFLMSNASASDLYNHPAVITMQNQIAELNSTVAALRQMLP